MAENFLWLPSVGSCHPNYINWCQKAFWYGLGQKLLNNYKRLCRHKLIYLGLMDAYGIICDYILLNYCAHILWKISGHLNLGSNGRSERSSDVFRVPADLIQRRLWESPGGFHSHGGIPKNDGWLVVEKHPSEKYEFVNWDDEINPIYGKMPKMATKPPTR